MLRVLKYLLISSVIVIVILLFFWFFAPGIILKSFALAGRSSADLKENKIQVDNITWHYLEGGKGDQTIVIFHGFGQTKDDWLSSAKELSPRFKLIIPDLPGFGKTKIPDTLNLTDSLGLDRLISEINKFISALEIDTFSLCGLSMGGGIAIGYAASFPCKVEKVAVLDPYGISAKIKSDFIRDVDDGKNPMLPVTLNDIDTLMKLISYKPLSIPKSIKKYILRKSSKDFELHKKMFENQINTFGWDAFDNRLTEIKSPLLVIWGQNDRVFDVSATQTIDSLLPSAEILIIDSCGHISILDRPEIVIPRLIKFYNN